MAGTSYSFGNNTDPFSDQSKLPLTSVTNNPDMSADRQNMVVTEHAVLSSNLRVGRKGWVSGTMVQDLTPYLAHGSTNASGVATIYLTSDGTSSGNAVFSSIYLDGIVAMPVGSTSNYQVTSVTVAGDKKSITVAVNQLGSVALGLVNVTSAASGVEVKAIVMGVYAG